MRFDKIGSIAKASIPNSGYIQCCRTCTINTYNSLVLRQQSNFIDEVLIVKGKFFICFNHIRFFMLHFWDIRTKLLLYIEYS